jgi:hypothetical protein
MNTFVVLLIACDLSAITIGIAVGWAGRALWSSWRVYRSHQEYLRKMERENFVMQEHETEAIVQNSGRERQRKQSGDSIDRN